MTKSKMALSMTMAALAVTGVGQLMLSASPAIEPFVACSVSCPPPDYSCGGGSQPNGCGTCYYNGLVYFCS